MLERHLARVGHRVRLHPQPQRCRRPRLLAVLSEAPVATAICTDDRVLAPAKVASSDRDAQVDRLIGRGAAVPAYRSRRRFMYRAVAAVVAAISRRASPRPRYPSLPGNSTFIPKALVMIATGRVTVKTTVSALITSLMLFDTSALWTSIRLATISRYVSSVSSARIAWAYTSRR